MCRSELSSIIAELEFGLTLSSAIGPYATIFQIWRDGRLPLNDEAEVPVWIL
jgi:hypothetical protein